MTKNQIAAIKAEKERVGRVRLARFVLGFFLIVSLSANVYQSLPEGPVGIGIGAFVPFSLFITNIMFERLSTNVSRVRKVITFGGIGAAVLISGYVSYVHIWHLVYSTTGNAVFAWILPLAVDAPMILASLVLSEARQGATPTEVPAKAVKPVATSTEAATAKPASAPRAPRTRATKINPQTA